MMNFMLSKNKNIVNRAMSVFLAFSLMIGSFAGLLSPAKVTAQSGYGLTHTGTTLAPFSVTLSGVATGYPYVGQLDDHFISILSWGDGSSSFNLSGSNFVITSSGDGKKGTQKFFEANWNASHTYAAVGNYTVTARVHHQTQNGAEGSDYATININVVIPPATLLVKKHVINDGPVVFGTKSASDFTLNVSGTSVSPASFSGSESGTVVSLNSGSYFVNETPAAGYNVSYSSDCSGSITSGQTKTCIVTNNDIGGFVNSAPVLNPIGNKNVSELSNLSFTASSTDADSDTLSFSLVGAPSGASIDSNTGVFTWTPSEEQGPGSFSFVVQVTDGLLTDSETITVSVDEVNTAPSSSSTSVSTQLNTSKTITLPASDFDLPANTLTYIIVNNPSNGTLGSVSGNQVTYTPNNGYTGSDSFTFKVNDGSLDSSVSTVSIIVNNDAPTIDTMGDQVASEMSEFSLVVSASDPNNDPLTYSLTGVYPSGASIDSNTGVFTWTPSEEQGPGFYPITISVNDGSASDSTTFTIGVNEVNVPPVASSQAVNTDEDNNAVVVMNATDSDLPANTLTYIIVNNPSNGTLGSVSGNQVTYIPNANYYGTDSFTFKANDGSVDSNEATVTINVSAVNDVPSVSLLGNNPINLLVGDVFTDPGATGSDVEDGNLNVITTGSVSTSTAGTYTLVYTVTDGNGAQASTTRNVIVTTAPVENTLPLCTDDIDNDNDGLTDLSDPDCSAFVPNSIPTLTLLGNNPIYLMVGDTFVDPGATSTDAEDGPITPVVSGTVNTGAPGTTTLIYTVTDSDGGVASTTRVVIVSSVPVTPTENTSQLCSDGIDNDNDNLIDLADSDCAAFVPPSGGGNGGGGGSSGGGGSTPVGNGPILGTFGVSNPGTGYSGGGLVLGASISADELGKILGEATCSTEYLTSYIKLGAKNDPEQVKKLQSFLNENQNANLPITGFYGPKTMDAVNKFQVAYGQYVLKPWVDVGLHGNSYTPTGYVYKTTKRWINLIMCPDLNLPIPQLP